MEKITAFLGVGNMASAILRGMTAGDPPQAGAIRLYDKDASKYAAFPAPGFVGCSSAREAVEKAGRVFLAVKPQNIPELFSELKGVDFSKKTVITIVAGLATATITAALGEDTPVIRTMPNTPLMIGMGVTALAHNAAVSDEEFQDILNVFRSVGEVLELPEEKMNTIISVTSSAPAYVYLFIDAIRASAERQGITGDEILPLICAMVKGSAEMMRRSDKTPAELIRIVTSPGGTTERAMKVFEDRDFRGIVDEAMQACTDRADELSGI